MEPANIILIGMPGCGKSTVGVLLAKTLRLQFIDTDLLIQANEQRRLQEIIDGDGLERFCRIEERHVLALSCRRAVVATGGSVVYSPAAMRHLAELGLIVHLDVPFDILARRLRDLRTRGVVKPQGVTLKQLYDERQPLYETWAALTIPCGDAGHESVVAAIVSALGGKHPS